MPDPTTTNKPTGNDLESPAAASAAVTRESLELAALAREAFEGKRRKECLVLTRALLLIDSQNKEAQVIENWIRSDMKRELENAGALAQDPGLKNNPQMRERAERMVRSVLHVEPDNEQAAALLSDLVSMRPDFMPRPPRQEFMPPPRRGSVMPPKVDSIAPPVPDSIIPPKVDTVAPPRPDSIATPVPDFMAPPKETDETEEMVPATHPFPDVAQYDPEDPEDPEAFREYGPPPEVRPWLRFAVPITLVLLIVVVVVWQFKGAWPLTQVVLSGEPAGTLDIGLDRSGVQVLVNDELRGTTPMQPLTLAAGTYQLKYQIEGRDVGNEEVTVAAGKTTSNSLRALMGQLVFLVIPATGVQLSVDNKPAGPLPSVLEVSPGEHRLRLTAEGYVPETLSATVEAGGRTMVPTILKSSLPPGATRPSAPVVALATPPSMGSLAVNSFVPADIYQGDRRIGSTPAILDLPSGNHTLEFRAGDLRSVGNYTIRSGARTTATVNFEVKVEINARPWADVFLDGVSPKEIGQTPLHDVSLLVGSVLVFRNPGYPEKKYRVTEKETAIQINLQ